MVFNRFDLIVAMLALLSTCDGSPGEDSSSSSSTSSEASSESSSSSTSSVASSGSSSANTSSVGSSESSSASSVESSSSSSSSSQGEAIRLTIEEHDAGFCRVDGTVDNNHQGFTGTGFANTDNEPGSAVTYRVSVPAAGHYDLEVRYASVGTRPADIQVNGSVAANLEFATTGSWSSWTTDSQTVEMRAGENDIALIATVMDGLPNVDSLTVIGNNPTAVDCSEISGGDPGGDTASSSRASSAVSSKASSSSASSEASSESSSSSASSVASSRSSSSSASSAASTESSSSSASSAASSKSSSSSASSVASSSGSSSSSSSSSPGDAFSLTIEEYDAGFCRVDGTVDNRHQGFTGVGYANTHDEPGSAVAYRVSVPDAGHYALEVRYASIDTRPADVQVNESVAGNFEFATTGSWTSWTVESQTVRLSAGENDIALVATGEDGLPSVDSLTVIGNSPTAVDCDDDGPMLPQEGNPVHSRFHSARTAWSQDQADIILSYQYDHGGWPRNPSYDDYYDDDDKDDDDSDDRDDDGSDLGTIDNGATVTEMIFLAQVYKDTGDTRYRDAVRKAMNYLLDAQYASGGWPQYYPLRGGYSDHVTFNDNAMTRVLTALYHASLNNTPFDTDLFTDSNRAAMQHAIERGVDYTLKAQWKRDGELTVWCAQHGKNDYQPKAARDHELESLSGSESAEIIAFLMTQPQTTEVEAAVKAGIAWYRSPDTYLADHTYDSSAKEKIVYSEGDRMWYRFYDLETNEGFFSDRDGDKYDDIMEISNGLRNSYTWGGSYGEKIISYADRVGY